MNNSQKYFAISLSLLIIIFSFTQCNMRKSEPLPAFNILLLDSSTIINTASISEENAFVLLYFSPDCDHCQREIKDLLRNMDKVKNTKFYFVTSNRFEELKAFNNEYNLTNYPNILVGRDYELFIIRNFKNSTPPYLAIYDKNKKQRAVFAGEAKAELIISVLNKI